MNTQKIVKLKYDEFEQGQGQDKSRETPKMYKIRTPMTSGVSKNLDFKLKRDQSFNKTILFRKRKTIDTDS